MRPHNAIVEEQWFGPSTRSTLWNNIPDNLEDGRLTNVGMYSMFNSAAAMCRGDSETTLSVKVIFCKIGQYPVSNFAV